MAHITIPNVFSKHSFVFSYVYLAPALNALINALFNKIVPALPPKPASPFYNLSVTIMICYLMSRFLVPNATYLVEKSICFVHFCLKTFIRHLKRPFYKTGAICRCNVSKSGYAIF